MIKLFKKDWILAMHPATPMFLLLSCMVLIPNYPYSVIFFYTGLAFFFTCLSGRENRDVFYSLSLPVAKGDVVRARMLFLASLQGIQLLLVGVLLPVSQKIYPEGNAAGLRANLAFLAWGFVVYTVFNAVYFEIYYRKTEKVGISFVVASIAVFLCVTFEIVAKYAIPFVRDVLDTKDPEFLGAKLAFLGGAVLLYAVGFLLTMKRAVKNFETQDL